MSQKNWVLPNWTFGDPAASWEEILILFVANLQMLNSVKLSFFRHPLEYKNIQFFSSNIYPPEIYGAKSIDWHGTWENNIKAENAWYKISHWHLQNKMRTKITNQLFKAKCMVQINQQPGVSAKPIRTIDWILFLRLWNLMEFSWILAKFLSG